MPIRVEQNGHSKYYEKDWAKRKLENYSSVCLVPVASLMFEKLLKNRVTPHLEENMTKFQTGGRKGKRVVDNLCILRSIIDHAKYLGRELWLTFYDIEKYLTVYGLRTA